MTQDKASKKAARKRMAETGERYTVASRAAKAESQGRSPQPEMTASSAQELAAQLAKQIDVTPDQSRLIYRAVQQYLARPGANEPSMQSVASELSEQLDQGMAEVIAAVRKLAPQSGGATLSGEGTLSGGGHLRAATGLRGEGTLSAGTHAMVFAGVAEGRAVVPTPQVITLSDTDSVRPENLNRLLTKASRDGIAGFSNIQVLALVLICLLAVGTPFAQLALPPEAQVLLADEYATIGLGLALVLAIVQNRKG